MLFDTHAHYDSDKFCEDRDEVISDARLSGVSLILNAGSDIESSNDSILLSKKFDFIYAAVGVHPHEVVNLKDCDIDTIANIAMGEKVVAIGEIGLDYYYDFSPREIQKIWFIRQINLAKDLNLPIIVHDRDAHEDTMKIIESEKAEKVGGVFHCYSGSVEMAKEVLRNKFYISVGGAVTFKNARKIVDIVKYIPMDRLLVETDCPYLTPEPHRGKRNNSSYVSLVVKKVAEIKGMSFEDVASITMENGKKLFGIK